MLTRKTPVALFTLTLICAGSVFAAPIDYSQAWGHTVETANQGAIDLLNEHQDQITQNKVDSEQAIQGLNTRISSVDDDLNSTKDAVLVVNYDLQQTRTDLNTQIDNTNNAVTQQKIDIDNALQQTNTNITNQITTVTNTTTQQTTRIEKDLQQTKQDVNQQISTVKNTSTQQSASLNKDLQQTKQDVNQQINHLQNAAAQQSASVEKDLQDAKQSFAQQQSASNSQFKNLKDEVDDNKKESRSGAASAIAIASMPQVQVGQQVMFSAGVGTFKNEQALSVGASFHAGDATVIKAGVSDSTNNDFAMGAGIGIGF
jgi:uncharacterized phage infection (PIP) family protein YhgE